MEAAGPVSRARLIAAAAALATLALVPPLLTAFGQEYYVGFVTRVLVFGLAAASLDFILGYGGMVSFGHAAFFGAGAYAVAALAARGIAAPGLAWPLAMAACAALAAAIGVVSLRTRGLYFIMITLAFAQMVHYLAISLPALGGDDGLALAPAAAMRATPLYYAALAAAAVGYLALARVADTPFGRALRGVRENDVRMEAIGHPVFRIRLAAFVAAGAVAGLAGALFATLNGRIGPGTLDWPQSGALLAMVILGGVGRAYGGFVGAAVLIAMEEFLPELWSHWQIALGILLIAIVLGRRP